MLLILLYPVIIITPKSLMCAQTACYAVSVLLLIVLINFFIILLGIRLLKSIINVTYYRR